MLHSGHMKISAGVSFGLFSLAVAFFFAFSSSPALAEAMIQGEGSTPTTGVSAESIDFGVKNVGLLPISPLYFLKEWRRDIVRAMATSPYAETVFQLQVLNEKVAEVQKVAEFRPKDTSSIKKALENYGSSLVRTGQALDYLTMVSPQSISIDFLHELFSKTEKHSLFLTALAVEYTGDEATQTFFSSLESKLVSLTGGVFKSVSPDLAMSVLGIGESSSTPPFAGSFTASVASEATLSLETTNGLKLPVIGTSSVPTVFSESGVKATATGTESIAPKSR